MIYTALTSDKRTADILIKELRKKLINILILRQLLLTKKLLKAPLFALKIYKNLPINMLYCHLQITLTSPNKRPVKYHGRLIGLGGYSGTGRLLKIFILRMGAYSDWAINRAVGA